MSRQSLQRLQADPIYQANLDWGKPRYGHPEGSLRNHILDLEANLERLADLLNDDERERLRLLIHAHDICKPQARRGVLSDHPDHHGLLARQLLERYCQDPALLAITQYHDDGYTFYTYFRWNDDLADMLSQLYAQVLDPELFLLFTLIDSSLPGKEPQPEQWLIDQFERRFGISERVKECQRRLQA